MSVYERGIERPTWGDWFDLLIAKFLLALRIHRVIGATVAFGVVVLPMVAMIGLLFLFGSAEPSTASHDGTWMLILAP
jgi:chromate transport protein ChrA